MKSSSAMTGIVLLVATAVSLSCADPDEVSANVVARFRDGVITKAEFEQRFLAAPPRERMATSGEQPDMVAMKRRFAKLLVAERNWLGEFGSAAADADEGFNNRKEVAFRKLLQRTALDRSSGFSSLVTEQEIRDFYEKRKPKLLMHESVTVRHIYVRVDEDASEQEWQRALERTRHIRGLLIEPGADIDELVRNYSESEDAGSGGWIRRLRPGTLKISRSFEDAIAELEEGEVSPPVKTHRGYQIVVLEIRKPERQISFDEVRDDLHRQILKVHQDVALESFVAEMRDRNPLHFDHDAFVGGEDDAVILSGGETKLTRTELARLEAPLIAQIDRVIDTKPDATNTYIEHLKQSQWMVEHAEKTNIRQDPEFVEVWRSIEEKFLIEFAFENMFNDWLAESGSETEIRTFFEENKARFSTQRKLHLKVLFLQYESEDLYATFALAEDLRERLDDGVDFAALVQEYGNPKGPAGDGDFGWNTHEMIASRGRRFIDSVTSAEIGIWTGPVRWDRGYAIIRVDGVENPQLREFDDIEPQARRTYARLKRQEFLEAAIEQGFESADGKLNESYFKALE